MNAITSDLLKLPLASVPIGRVIGILDLVEQATLLRGPRQACVIDGRVCDVPDSPDDGMLRRLDGAEIA